MVFIDYNNANIDCNFELKVRDINGDDVSIFSKNGIYLAVYESLPGVGAVAYKNKEDFFKNTEDFDNKDYYFYKYSLWPELGNDETPSIDLDMYKC